MKWETAKKSKKWLKILKRNGFRAPFQIIADSSFLKAANAQKVRQSSFNELFRGEPKFYITKCTYEKHKTQLIDRDFSGCCEIVKCGHEKVEEACSFTKETNSHHYILATNDRHSITELKENKYIPTLNLIKGQITINCNKLDCAPPARKTSATKRELRHLKKMFG